MLFFEALLKKTDYLKIKWVKIKSDLALQAGYGSWASSLKTGFLKIDLGVMG